MMRVTYLSHSGFVVEMDDACFLFDYYTGEIPDIDRDKQLFVFVLYSSGGNQNSKRTKSETFGGSSDLDGTGRRV